MKTICMHLPVGALFASLLAVSTARAQAVEFERSLLGLSSGDAPGPVCLRGARLMVSAPGASTVAPGAGEVQCFQYGDPPTFVMSLYGSDTAAGDSFGAAMALDGDRLVVGATNHAHAGQGSGSAYVFAWNGAAWVEEGELLRLEGADGDSFGMSVDISGNTIIVGAGQNDEGSNPDEGAAYVFERVTGVWTMAQKLVTPDHGLNENFGWTVALDGDRLAVGSRYGDGGYPVGLGAVFTFHRTGATWTQDGRLVQPPSSGGYSTFGWSLDMAGDVVAVGQPYSTGYGNIHMFRQSAGTWSLEATLTPPTNGYGGFGLMGYSLELFDDRIVTGAVWYSPYGFSSGGAGVFQREAATWASYSQSLIFVPRGGSQGDNFGRALAFDGQHAVVCSGGSTPYVYTYDAARRVGSEFCSGDGSGSPCPCGNTSHSGGGMGCSNDNVQRGGKLAAWGTTSVAADDLVCSIIGLGPNQAPMVLFAGTARINGGLGTAFGDGLRCIGGTARRLGNRTGTSNYGIAEYGPGFIALTGWSAGQTRLFQCFYRSVNGPCGFGFNMTNALEITFTP